MEMKILENIKNDKEKLIVFLKENDSAFPIHLNDRVNIADYANKILENGKVLTYQENHKIIAAILFYANNMTTKEAYISLLCVEKEYQGKHLASNLLKEATKIIIEKNMEKIKLYTHKKNEIPQKLYEKYGFIKVKSDREHSICYRKYLNKNKKVLLTAIGSFSADIVIKTLHDMNYEITGCDIYHKTWIADGNNVEYFEQAPYATEEEKYIDFIEQVCIKYKIKYIIPLTDVEVDVLCKFKEKFLEKGIQICISDKDVIQLCRNKLKLPQELETTCKENLIATKLLSEIETSRIEFPIIVKPIDGRSSQGLAKIYNKEQLEFYKKMCETPNKVIVQPLIQGDVITVDVVSDLEHQITVCIPRRELLRTGNGAGTTVETFYEQKLIKICEKIVRKLNIKGAINIEFIEKNKGEYYFLEINPRFSGGLEFSHIAGYNVVENHMRCFNSQPIDTKMFWKNLIIARKYEEYIMEEK